MNIQTHLMPLADKDLKTAIAWHLRYTVGETEDFATISHWRVALSHAIRDLIVMPWFASKRDIHRNGSKRVYYLSMEFLIGRLLEDAIVNLGLVDEARHAMSELGVDYHQVVTDEPDAALGNGGLGRLAACFLDSMATLGIPSYGYGIRYNHGLFKQRFHDGWQLEDAEDWLTQGHAWEFERTAAVYAIGFGGEVKSTANGKAQWQPAENILACAFDTPIPGWRGQWVNTLRLWKARSTEVFNLEPFNRGDFIGAAASSVLAETLSRVLYPDDTTPEGKRLRLKQEYFFTAASLRDLIWRFKRDFDDLRLLPEKVSIQLNDTHPAIAGPELVRVLTDENGFDFADAVSISRQCLNYTNHTLMPEALEKWPVGLMQETLPRHMQLIEQIDDFHDKEVSGSGGQRSSASRLIDNDHVQMGNVAFVTSRRVNGVSQLHTDLMRTTVFKELNAFHPDKILCQTNGVAPRRWLRGCNPGLSQLLTRVVGDGWEVNLDQLEKLKSYSDDVDFVKEFAEIKRQNKLRLRDYLKTRIGFEVDPDAMFDIQIKRIHEYKRQLMNALEAAALWNAMRKSPDATFAPRVKIFGGKAAPGYELAKQIIKLINDIAKTINADSATNDRLKIIYPADYNVSMAEVLIPAADLSEQISTAGMEASGTGNMKFAMNGALTIGTLDGANVEIRDRVGDDNIFIFGMTADEVTRLRHEGYDPSAAIAASPALNEVVDQIAAGVFSPDEPHRFHGLVDQLRHHDWFMVAADFQAYFDCQRHVDSIWMDQARWQKMAILNAAGMGWFSSDRTIRGYANDIWQVGCID